MARPSGERLGINWQLDVTTPGRPYKIREGRVRGVGPHSPADLWFNRPDAATSIGHPSKRFGVVEGLPNRKPCCNPWNSSSQPRPQKKLLAEPIYCMCCGLSVASENAGIRRRLPSARRTAGVSLSGCQLTKSHLCYLNLCVVGDVRACQGQVRLAQAYSVTHHAEQKGNRDGDVCFPSCLDWPAPPFRPTFPPSKSLD